MLVVALYASMTMATSHSMASAATQYLFGLHHSFARLALSTHLARDSNSQVANGVACIMLILAMQCVCCNIWLIRLVPVAVTIAL